MSKLNIGDLVQCLATDNLYYVKGFHANQHDKIIANLVHNTQAGPMYVDVSDLVKYVRGKPHSVYVPFVAPQIVPAKKQRVEVPRVDPVLPSEDDMEYNLRKDRANAVFYAKFRQLVSATEVRALLLDAPPRGFAAKKPNTAEFLIEKKRVPPSHIVVINPCPAIAETLVDMGVGVHQVMFNDFVLEQRPDAVYNYLYLDACGFYGKQLRSGLRAMFENHDRWLSDEALLSIVVSKRNGKDVPGLIKKDLDKWASRYGYGNVLSTLSTPDNPRMHTATFFLKRFPHT